jgi:hypothetical protein
MKNRQGLSAISIAWTVLALASCRTEEISGAFLIPSDQAGPDKGGLVVGFSPTEETYEAAEQDMENPSPTQYYLFVDGEAVTESGGSPPFTIAAGGNPNWAYYLTAGPHHFSIAAPGQAPVYQVDGAVPGDGGTVNLFLYGPLDAVQGVLAPTPQLPSPGNEHITVVNLMRSGQTIEVVTCNDATTCTPISAALALGELFDAEVPAVIDDCNRSSPSSVPGTWSGGGCFTSRTTSGAGIGYRLVPSVSLPNPPVSALTWGISGSQLSNGPPIFVAAPVFMTAQGQPQFVLF